MRAPAGSPASPPRRGGGASADGALPPLARSGGSCPLPKLAHGQGLIRGGSRDCAFAAPPPPVAEGSEGPLSVACSPLSGSSKLAFPPDRAYVNDFQWTLHSRDLPLDVRPIVEDNKMLQEELRRYKMRVGEQEGQLAAKERQLVALRDELARERQRFKDCGAVSPDQLLQDQQFRQMLQDRDASILQLQQKAVILERAKASAERRLTNDLAAERRVQTELRKQLKQLQDDMAEKQKQSRFNQLHINQLYKRLEPLEAAVAAAAAPAPALPPAALPPEPEERVQLMLCMVYAQPQPTAAEIAEAAARLAAEQAALAAAELRRRQEPAAVRIQAAFRGFRARRQLAERHAAAIAIQAAARGMLARLAVGLLRSQKLGEPGQPILSPAQRLSLRQQAAEQMYRERLAARGQTGRRASVAASRGANTAVEAAARQRSLLGSGGQGGAASPGPPPSSSGSGGGAGRISNAGNISGSSPTGSSPAGASRPGGASGSSSSGASRAAKRASRASVAYVPGLEALQQAQQARGSFAQGSGGDSSRSARGSVLVRSQGTQAQPDGQFAVPKRRPSVSLGFASSTVRRSIQG